MRTNLDVVGVRWESLDMSEPSEENDMNYFIIYLFLKVK
jgi:hypothetical protein